MNTTVARLAIHRKVLVVARKRVEGTWKAYVFPVPGRNHDAEEALWRAEGSQLPEKQARAFFPQMDDVPYSD